VLSRKSPLVVKIGGSLAGSPELSGWLAALELFAGPLVLVPGGGVFADAVRGMQAKMQFDDVAAHRMALLAMQQYGLALCSLWPRLCCADSIAGIRVTLKHGRVACWTPRNVSGLPQTWDVTSDTLAAWLAGSLRAKRLLLIKSAEAKPSANLADLAEAGMVDPLFATFAAASGAKIFIAGPQSLPRAAQDFAQDDVPGVSPGLAPGILPNGREG